MQEVARQAVFYGLNGVRLILTDDEAYDLVMAVAAGDESIAARLEAGTAEWS